MIHAVWVGLMTTLYLGQLYDLHTYWEVERLNSSCVQLALQTMPVLEYTADSPESHFAPVQPLVQTSLWMQPP